MQQSFVLALCFWVLSTVASGQDRWPVRLQLQYFHQFQFAGFYAADFLGLYKKAGLDVTILENEPRQQPVTAVLNGFAEFGVSDTEVLWRRLQGEPLVALGVIFQQSAYCLVTLNRSDIMTLNDLKGKKVGIAEGRGSYLFHSMFQKQHIPLDSMTIINPKWDLQSLINGETDANGAYATGEIYRLRELGLPFQMIYPLDYGVAFYGDTLFTTDRFLREHADIVEKFRKASFEGWRYAFDHVEETIDYILTLPSVQARKVSRERLRYEATMMRHLILPDIIEPGSMSEARWRSMAADLNQIQNTPGDLSRLDGFIYQSPQEKSRLLQQRIVILTSIFAVMLLLSLIWILVLRKLVKQRTAELSKAKHLAEVQTAEAQKADTAKTMFLAGISHEFRTPLTAILGFSDILKKTELHPQQQQWLRIIQERADDLLALVNQTLELIGAEVDASPRKVVDFDLRQQIDDIVLSLTPSAKDKGISIQTDLGPRLPEIIRGSVLMLRQILLNLIGNAVKFVPHGGLVTITGWDTEADKDLIEPHIFHFAVRDNGPGICPEMESLLFKPFASQIQHGHEVTQKGFGLGLTICKRLATALSGDIWFENNAEGGCTFHVTASFLVVKPAAAPHEDREPAAQPKKILLVDDDPINRELLKTYLSMYGYALEEADTGLRAVNVCAADKFDLILMDIGLPDIDGIKATLRILNDEQSLNKKTPVVALTAAALQKDRERCLNAGMVAFLTKPINFHDLLFTIQGTTNAPGKYF
jgi:signal transduction histidine kinase/ActR/RegA family two-component response regulator